MFQKGTATCSMPHDKREDVSFLFVI